MFPFISPDAPDQFYRLFTSLCLHAGIIPLVITVAFQHIFLTDLERLLGPIRTAILYIGSGVAGNLISAIFLPYKPEVILNNQTFSQHLFIFILYLNFLNSNLHLDSIFYNNEITKHNEKRLFIYLFIRFYEKAFVK